MSLNFLKTLERCLSNGDKHPQDSRYDARSWSSLLITEYMMSEIGFTRDSVDEMAGDDLPGEHHDMKACRLGVPAPDLRYQRKFALTLVHFKYLRSHARCLNCCAADLPAALWQSIYLLLGSQHDVCCGMLVCKFFESSLPAALHHAVVHRAYWDRVPGGCQVDMS